MTFFKGNQVYVSRVCSSFTRLYIKGLALIGCLHLHAQIVHCALSLSLSLSFSLSSPPLSSSFFLLLSFSHLFIGSLSTLSFFRQVSCCDCAQLHNTEYLSDVTCVNFPFLLANYKLYIHRNFTKTEIIKYLYKHW